MNKMFLTRIILYSFLIILVNHDLFGQTEEQKPRNSFVFHKIDNQAQIFINDKLVYDSGVIEKPLKSKIEVDINDFLSDGSNTVMVKLFNAKCEECRSNMWIIEYEVYDNGEYLDFVFEKGYDKLEEMEVFSQSYEWSKR